jgi:chromosome segregation ATPase
VNIKYQDLKKYVVAMKKELETRTRELADIKPMYQKNEEENKRLNKQLAALDQRYQDQSLELQLLRQKVEYDNEQIKNRMNEMRDTMARKGQMTRLSMMQIDPNAGEELSEEIEKRYL